MSNSERRLAFACPVANRRDKCLWRTGLFAFCFRQTRPAARKLLTGQRLHFAGATGGPIRGDIIPAICRLAPASRP
jgi:hypothetical protein